jgi:hypothetical protein
MSGRIQRRAGTAGYDAFTISATHKAGVICDVWAVFWHRADWNEAVPNTIHDESPDSNDRQILQCDELLADTRKCAQ